MKNFAVPSANAQAKRRHVPVAKFHTIFGHSILTIFLSSGPSGLVLLVEFSAVG